MFVFWHIIAQIIPNTLSVVKTFLLTLASTCVNQLVDERNCGVVSRKWFDARLISIRCGRQRDERRLIVSPTRHGCKGRENPNTPDPDTCVLSV
jgi:hypothetical protein